MKRTLSVIWDAIYHFNNDDGWAMASHVAMSVLLALFPFVIFGAALASFLGASAYSETVSHLIFDTWPAAIATPIANELVEVLTVDRGGLLTLSVLAALFFSANGVEALRMSLNRAYRMIDNRAWYLTRLQSVGFVIMAVLAVVAVSFLVVLGPVVVKLARQYFPLLEEIITAFDQWRIVIAIVVLVIGMIIAHKWLPAGERRVIDVLPGVIVTLVAWSAGALLFAWYLQALGTYVATYAGLASIVVALVFLNMIAVIFIFGAEVNAAIMKMRARARARKNQ
ncbi:YihY/virulence factor BrkB family protein [Pseudohoeflea coraliihabitans]|uniref:YihY/virulence factor BrkB family protein n=1 Tax=Pseudohoeflea coraliihabitans TaxID=2860393 RepID=A0ABS6WKM7_9HYPH|nr:YihY/virulence factor BrkB family protein [Pseudohoeflea sp. DP4N28-3]MBW3096506.1 YihY/virulence factor BrkB family protein [Pseudohoeflea sp. DP4N28-3]